MDLESAHTESSRSGRRPGMLRTRFCAANNLQRSRRPTTAASNCRRYHRCSSSSSSSGGPGLTTLDFSAHAQDTCSTDLRDVQPVAAGPNHTGGSQAGLPGMSNGHAGTGDSHSRRPGHLPWLQALNESSKWVVSAAAALTLILKHDAPVMWCLLGSVVSAFLNKALKHVVNERRPVLARKQDPGMPSSHANSLAFLGVYAAAAMVIPGPGTLTHGAELGSRMMPCLAASAIMACSVFMTWLRVALGYHTTPQVVVGYLLGGCTAITWLLIGRHHALPLITGQDSLRRLLQLATYVAIAAFAARILQPLIERLRSHLSSGKRAPST